MDFELTLGPYVEMSSKLGVILDFDGTLSYLAPVSNWRGRKLKNVASDLSIVVGK